MKKLNDKEEMNFTAFIDNLKTHEIKMKVREERESQKKQDVSFKITPSKSKKDKDDDKNLSERLKRVELFLYKQHRKDKKKAI